MKKGRSNKLVGATGEYLVAAELSRRGLIATTFTGNVPHYDIIASDDVGHHVSIQVKASRSGSWQFANITNFCEINFSGKRQNVGKGKPSPIKRLVFVFVRVDADGDDDFFVLTWRQLRNLLVKQHREYLERHGGIRPKSWDSLHAGIVESSLGPYRDKWDTVAKNLK